MPDDEGYLCVCPDCRRTERTVANPLRDGWPECCGRSMTLLEGERFSADADKLVAECFQPLEEIAAGFERAMRAGANGKGT